MSQTSAAVLGSARADPAPRSGLYGSSAERSGTSGAFSEDRFLTRARALFYARLAFLVLGLGVIGVPSWSQAFGVGGPRAYAVYLVMVAYSAANYVFLPKKRVGRILTFATLCADLCVLVWLVSVTGGLRSPLLAAQLLFTTLFVVLFPTPLAVVPPLLTFPVVAKLDQMLGGHAVVQIDIFILLWYSAINCILVYVMVYLNERDRMKHRELNKLSKTVREMAIVEERNRLAREIHDGLGGVLSSVAIQSEYLLNMIDGSEVRSRLQGTNEARAAILPTIRKELSDLHSAAEDSMDELRRSLRMMMEDFDLVATLGDYCKLASGRHRAGPRRALWPRQHARARQQGRRTDPDDVRTRQGDVHRVDRSCRRGAREMSVAPAKPPVSDKIKVVVVEDQPQILKNQLKILAESQEIEVIGTALSGEAALELLEKKQPDVILQDLGLPRMTGIEVTRAVKKRWPQVEVLVFTIFDEEEKVIEAVKAGASGYLLKGASSAKVIDAIKEVKAGGSVIQPNLARRLLKHFHVPEEGAPPEAPYKRPLPPGNREEPPTRPLTEREIEILRLIAKGLSNNEAAGVLTLSRATVRTHLEHIYEKLEVTNRVEAVTEGLRKGLIEM